MPLTRTIARPPASAPSAPSTTPSVLAADAPASGRILARDRLSEGVRISVELTPLDVPDREVVVAAVRALIGLGPAARAGRTFHGETWAYDPEHLDAQAERMVRRLPEGFAGDTGLPRLRELVEDDLPFVVFLGDDRAALCIDHRLGDGFLSVMLTAGVLAGRGAPAVLSTADDADPLPAALRATFGHDRRRVIDLVRGRLGERRGIPTAPVDTVISDRGPLALATRAMEPETFRALAAWSRGRVPPTVAVLFALRRALVESGVPVGDEGAVLVDLRRYLPSGRSTIANFVVGHPLRTSDGIDAAGARFTRDLHAGRPLAALTMGLLSRGWRRRPPGRVPSTAYPIVSDMGFLRALEPLPWSSDDAVVRVSVDSAGRTGITALTAVLRRRLHVSVSYDAGMFDADLIADAVARLCADPIGLLS